MGESHAKYASLQAEPLSPADRTNFKPALGISSDYYCCNNYVARDV